MTGAELKDFALLDELSEEERDLLAEELEEEEVIAGRALFEEGAEADGMLFVLDGALSLETREQGELGRIGPGATLGALSLVVPGRRELTALVAEPARVAWLERTAFRRLMSDSPGLAGRLLESLLRTVASDLREGLPGLRQTLPSDPNDGPD